MLDVTRERAAVARRETPPAHPPGRAGRADVPGHRARRRSLPRILGGAVAALLGATVFGVLGLSADPATEVLSVARPVPAGAVLADADLTVVRVLADPALRAIPATDKAAVVGQVAAVPLAAGTLLSRSQLGAATDPPPGQSVIAVAVKPGHAPLAALAPGASVTVLVVAPSTGTDTAPVRAAAVVRHVAPADSTGLTVVLLQLPAEPAEHVASAPGEVTLVLRNPQGRQ